MRVIESACNCALGQVLAPEEGTMLARAMASNTRLLPLPTQEITDAKPRESNLVGRRSMAANAPKIFDYCSQKPIEDKLKGPAADVRCSNLERPNAGGAHRPYGGAVPTVVKADGAHRRKGGPVAPFIWMYLAAITLRLVTTETGLI
ncbi:MAG: hypothetical protein BJ554DRAFT_7015 [Olpidium bornovanus]|uniref:Uncharacterized protein n=1 Tax=Olpidium bornovanus TaxID=278681 RepID=A0A8H7ZWN2_9FUNG|nr:MAG: hypothetical protein BJ554DRAFT_7015 [Olpidium bornovanus]